MEVTPFLLKSITIGSYVSGRSSLGSRSSSFMVTSLGVIDFTFILSEWAYTLTPTIVFTSSLDLSLPLQLRYAP